MRGLSKGPIMTGPYFIRWTRNIEKSGGWPGVNRENHSETLLFNRNLILTKQVLPLHPVKTLISHIATKTTYMQYIQWVY